MEGAVRLSMWAELPWGLGALLRGMVRRSLSISLWVQRRLGGQGERFIGCFNHPLNCCQSCVTIVTHFYYWPLTRIQDHYQRIQLLTGYLEKQERPSTSWKSIRNTCCMLLEHTDHSLFPSAHSIKPYWCLMHIIESCMHIIELCMHSSMMCIMHSFLDAMISLFP